MADSHPFANTGLSQFGGDRRYGMGSADTGLGSFAAAYLAHKTGLIDYSDKTQRQSVDKNGVLGHLLKGVMDKSAPMKGPGYGSNFNPAANTGISNDGNADIGGGFNPAGSVPAPSVNAAAIVPPVNTALPALPAIPPVAQAAPLNPTSGNAGMDQQLSSFAQPPQYTTGNAGMDAQLGSFPQMQNTTPPVALHDFDSDISNYAGMMGVDDLSSLASFFI
ncbi:hypothetical protein UFOVP996_10 [uncultured Caudovirales phage]|uniref:Uncharacterized protein n=1 Tax=uncultured Caudovirales phage TaxID=2100421 RepID=A0A6J5PVE5_9CAUD|nr:hypothetical protein UFOVP996_10 [uncultured Caudovirales phage]